jgi:hypothetical protein
MDWYLNGLFRYNIETNSFRRFLYQEDDPSSIGDNHIRTIAGRQIRGHLGRDAQRSEQIGAG